MRWTFTREQEFIPGKELCHGLQHHKIIRFMEFESIIKYHLVTTQHEYVGISNYFNQNDAIPSFAIRHNNTQDALSLVNFLFVEDPIPFNYTITIDAGNESAKFSREWLSALIPLIAHVNYFKCDSEYLVLIKDKGQNSTLLNELKNEFGRIGFNNIAFDNVLNIHTNETCRILYFDHLPADINKVWPLVYEKLFYLNSPLNIAVNVADIISLKNIKPELDKKLSSLDEKIKMLITRLFKTENVKHELIERNHKLNQQNTSKQAYLDFILNQTVNGSGDFDQQLNEALKIRKFYHYEYEILPLWYKRLGHVIKVLMGKRSFKSLFNDNIKKYKD